MDEEPTLLHEPDLMLALLRAAGEGPAGPDEAAARLLATLAAAGEPAPADPAGLRGRLERAADLLAAAGALGPAGGGRFRLTPCGARLLAGHPDGVDVSVLERLPGFRAPVAGRARRRGPVADPRLAAYEAGARAFAAGLPLDANPHEDDGADHLGWENGWCEARDEAAARDEADGAAGARHGR
jgi:restriction system protein